MQKTANLAVTTLAVVSATLTLSKTKAYVNELIQMTASWTVGGVAGGAANLQFITGDGNNPIVRNNVTSPWTISTFYTRTSEAEIGGQFTAALLVTDIASGSTGSGSRNIQIRALLAITSFTANPTSGTVPLAVTFNRTVTGGFTPYLSETLDPGDGSGSKSATFPYTYTYTKGSSPTSFTATYTVTDALGVTSLTIENIQLQWNALTNTQKALCVVGVLVGIAGLVWKLKKR